MQWSESQLKLPKLVLLRLVPTSETVMIAVLVLVVGFVCAIKVIVLFPEPELIFVVNHFSEPDKVQLLADVISNVLELLACAGIINEFVDRIKSVKSDCFRFQILFELVLAKILFPFMANVSTEEKSGKPVLSNAVQLLPLLVDKNTPAPQVTAYM